MCYIQYSMGFFWTKDGHKYKHTSGPSSLTDEDQTQEARGVGRRRIYSLPLQFSARNIYRKYNRKRSCLGNTPKFIQTVYRISSKSWYCLFLATTAKPFRGERCLGHCKRTWETWFCFNKYLLGAYYMQGTVESQITPLPLPLKKEVCLKSMSWHSETNSPQSTASLATEKPSLIPHCVAGSPPVSSSADHLPPGSLSSIPVRKLSPEWS